MAKLISIFRRDIPARVTGRVGRTGARRELPPRFARDRSCADALRSRLAHRLPDEHLESVARAGGLIDQTRGAAE